VTGVPHRVPIEGKALGDEVTRSKAMVAADLRTGMQMGGSRCAA